MDRWVRHLARQVAAGGLCLTVLAGMLKGLGPLEMLLRGVVIGLVLYFAILLVGGLIGQALLRLAVEEQRAAGARRAQERRERSEAEDDESEGDERGEVAEDEEEDEEEEEEEEGIAGQSAGGTRSGKAA